MVSRGGEGRGREGEGGFFCATCRHPGCLVIVLVPLRAFQCCLSLSDTCFVGFPETPLCLPPACQHSMHFSLKLDHLCARRRGGVPSTLACGPAPVDTAPTAARVPVFSILSLCPAASSLPSVPGIDRCCSLTLVFHSASAFLLSRKRLGTCTPFSHCSPAANHQPSVCHGEAVPPPRPEPLCRPLVCRSTCLCHLPALGRHQSRPTSSPPRWKPSKFSFFPVSAHGRRAEADQSEISVSSGAKSDRPLLPAIRSGATRRSCPVNSFFFENIKQALNSQFIFVPWLQ